MWPDLANSGEVTVYLSNYIWETFDRIFVTENFQKSNNLVTLVKRSLYAALTVGREVVLVKDGEAEDVLRNVADEELQQVV